MVLYKHLSEGFVENNNKNKKNIVSKRLLGKLTSFVFWHLYQSARHFSPRCNYSGDTVLTSRKNLKHCNKRITEWTTKAGIVMLEVKIRQVQRFKSYFFDTGGA